MCVDRTPTNATTPVWIENHGLCTDEATVSFEELADLLKELAKFADRLSSPSVRDDSGPKGEDDSRGEAHS